MPSLGGGGGGRGASSSSTDQSHVDELVRQFKNEREQLGLVVDDLP
jgi:hypothetical protein